MSRNYNMRSRKRQKTKSIKKDKRFTRKMQTKLAVLFIIIMLALIGLNVRLAYINIESGDRYTRQVLAQQQYDSKVIPFRRGNITDSKGTVMATSQKVYNVILDCKVINTKEDYIQPTVTALTSCFDIDESELRETLKEKADSRYVVLLKRLTYDEIQPFVELTNETDEKGNKVNPNIKGVWFEDEYLRTYPYSTLAASVLGFTVSGNVGNWGIEQYYNDELNGIDGREFGYLNDESELERTVKNPTDGNTIVSTLDVTVQSIVEKHIAAFNEKYKGNFREDDDGSKNTAVVIANPQDGSIIAMASSANQYDLNNPRDLSGYFTESEIEAMDDDTKLENLNKIWKNFCITDTYEPGSTAKPLTIAGAIDSGTIKGTESFYCGKYLTVGGHDINCVSTFGHGDITVEQSLMKSCNVALMRIAFLEEKETFSRYQSIFNIGRKTGIDLPGEESGLIYNVNNMDIASLATNSFGQNFNTTMIQMTAAFSSVINGGKYYKPRVVSKIIDPNGATVETIEPVLLKQTVSKSTSDMLKKFLYSTVCGTAEEGATGRYAKVDGYSMGGKTGTAEKVKRDKENYVVSFIGYVPQDNPQLVIYTLIDEPNVAEQAHSQIAQELTKDILEEVLPYLNIFPTEPLTQTHDEPEEGEDGEGGDDTKEDTQTQEGADTTGPSDGSGNTTQGTQDTQGGTTQDTGEGGTLGDSQDGSQGDDQNDNQGEGSIPYDMPTGSSEDDMFEEE